MKALKSKKLVAVVVSLLLLAAGNNAFSEDKDGADRLGSIWVQIKTQMGFSR